MMHRVVARSLLVGSALTLALTACGQAPSSVSADPYAGGVSYPWSYTAPPNQLTPLSLTAGENNLYYEPILAARNAWGPIEIDRSNGEQQAGDGKTLTLNGTTYARGYGTHAGSELRFSLKGTDATCTRFTSQIGLDDEVGSKGSVVFQVYLDGQQAYDSGTMTGASATKTVSLDLTGKQELRLVVTDAGNGIDYDHANWAKPLIFCVASTSSTPRNGSRDHSFGENGQIGLTGLAKFVQVLQQPDGKLLAVTEDRPGPAHLQRYELNGRLDPTYGQNGEVALPPEFVARVANFAPGGKVMLGGVLSNGIDDFISRHLPDGRLDPSFGTGGILRVNSDALTIPFVVQPDGKVVVMTSIAERPDDVTTLGDEDTLLTRHTLSGAVDPTFGTAGQIVLNGQANPSPQALLQQADGKLVLIYRQFRPDAPKGTPVLTRFTSDGQLDLGFGTAGTAQAQTNARVMQVQNYALVQQADGKILFASGVRDVGGTLALTINRFTAQGQPDLSFGDAGVATLPKVDTRIDLGVQMDGKILVGMERAGVVLRLQSDGRLDTSYGNQGLVGTGIEAGDLRNMLLQADGRLLLNVSRFTSPEAGFLIRLLP